MSREDWRRGDWPPVLEKSEKAREEHNLSIDAFCLQLRISNTSYRRWLNTGGMQPDSRTTLGYELRIFTEREGIDGTEQVAFRLPRALIEDIDERAKEMTKEHGFKVNRTNVAEAAFRMYLGESDDR